MSRLPGACGMKLWPRLLPLFVNAPFRAPFPAVS